MSFYAKSYMFCFEHKSKMIKIKPRKYVYILLILGPDHMVFLDYLDYFLKKETMYYSVVFANF